MPTKKKAPIAEEPKAAPPASTELPYALASEDPKFPPIHVRFNVLKAVPLSDLIAWAKSLATNDIDATLATLLHKDEAIRIILLHEYGAEAYNAWAKA